MIKTCISGEVLCRFGSFESTPYPIGVDVSTNGDVLVADSHGNHFHIYCCATDGQRLQEFECSQLKASYLIISCKTFVNQSYYDAKFF